MRKVIAGINMTLDGYCDHTAVIPNEDMHQHYTDLLNNFDTILYGRVTYQLMEFWKPFIENPTGEKHMDDFAIAIDKITKVVFSHTLQQLDWRNSILVNGDLKDEVVKLKQQSGRDILIGSPSLIVSLLRLGLIDELQLFVHPVIVGSGLPLFKNIHEKINLKLIKTKTFAFGGIILYYQPIK